MRSAPLIPERGAACLVFDRCPLPAATRRPFGPSRPFKEHLIYEQSAARDMHESRQNRTCIWSRQPLKIEQLHEAAV